MNQLNHTSLQHTLLGEIQLEPLNISQHIPTISQWLVQDYAKFWGMNNMDEHAIEANYRNLMNSNSETAYVGSIEGKLMFLIEVYDVNHHEISSFYQPMSGDIGMHILLAPAKIQQSGFSKAVMEVVLDFIFNHLAANRVVVEPDIDNEKIHRLNQSVGFTHSQRISLNEKDALLGFVTKEEFEQAKSFDQGLNSSKQLNSSKNNATAFTKQLNLTNWRKANRELVTKIITEFSHERLISPEQRSDGYYYLTTENEQIIYQFCAKTLPLAHLAIDPNSLIKKDLNVTVDIEAMSFILEFSHQLKLSTEQLGTYLEEVSSTLNASCYKLEKQSYSSAELALQTFQVVESEMTHGHPSFVASNGRIGFSSNDYHQFSPEAANSLQLIWLACHRSHTDFHSIDDLTYQTLIDQELDLSEQVYFEKTLVNKGVNPQDYILFPMHPWQWENKLVHLYAKEIAHQQIICLGQGHDKYLPQQSIRTLYNLSHPDKFYVKTALSILNMGFMRGLSAKYMAVTPAINQWLFELVTQDKTLAESNFVALQELATVGFSGSVYEDKQLGDTPYKKMLAALWRENPSTMLKDNESLATMASLLHLDNDGEAFITAKVRASNVSIEKWLSCYFKVYLTPLLHCFYQYKLVFMPHGENLIIKFENHLPSGVFIKDIGEEVCLLNSDRPLPENVARISINMPEEMEILSIFTDVFDCFFRYLVAILEQKNSMNPESFWRLVAIEIKHYQVNHPHLTEQFERYDLFADEFSLSCLNRLQLSNNKQMVDITDPANSLQFAGMLANPLAPFAGKNLNDLTTENEY